MLDPATQFTLPQAPQVQLYRDHTVPHRFYAVPSRPRLARGEAGRPEISLLLYRKEQGNSWQPTGGFLTLTAVMALTEAERSALRSALAERLQAMDAFEPAGRTLGGSNAQPAAKPLLSDIQLVSPDWHDGFAILRLGQAELAKGKPSLSGDNRVSFSIDLSADGVQALQKALESGLVDLTLAYHLQASAAERSTQSGEAAAQSTGPTDTTQSSSAHFRATYEIESIRSIPYPLVIAGPLEISPEAAADSMQIIQF